MNIFADMASTPRTPTAERATGSVPIPTTQRAIDTTPINTKRSAAEFFKCLISEY